MLSFMWRKAHIKYRFHQDVLVKTILGLKKHIDEDTIGKRLVPGTKGSNSIT